MDGLIDVMFGMSLTLGCLTPVYADAAGRGQTAARIVRRPVYWQALGLAVAVAVLTPLLVGMALH